MLHTSSLATSPDRFLIFYLQLELYIVWSAHSFLAFVFLFTLAWFGLVCHPWGDSFLALVPELAYSSGLGANLCVSWLYSQACLHAPLHLGLFWHPVKAQTSETNSVWEENTHACLITTGHSPSPRFLSTDLPSERMHLFATLHYCRLSWKIARWKKEGINI